LDGAASWSNEITLLSFWQERLVANAMENPRVTRGFRTGSRKEPERSIFAIYLLRACCPKTDDISVVPRAFPRRARAFPGHAEPSPCVAIRGKFSADINPSEALAHA